MSDVSESLNRARQRVLAGEEISIEEQRELLRQLREVRGTIASSPAPKKSTKSKPAAAPISDDELDRQLGDLGL
jgi:hypothetical protein